MIKTFNILLIFLVFLFSLGGCKKHKEARVNGTDPAELIVEDLVYISDKSGSFDIYRNTLHGQKESRITSATGWEWFPQYVPAKNIVVYNSMDTTGVFRTMAMSLKGDTIVNFPKLSLPEIRISDEGRWIAYVRQKNKDTSNILIAPLYRLGDSLQVTHDEGYNGRPVWSPDSKNLAFISDRTGTNEVYLFDMQTKQVRRVTKNNKREKYMSWRPDGKLLGVTMENERGINDIYVIDFKNQRTERLTDTPYSEEEIRWSDSGDKIAYHSKIDDRDDIYVLKLKSDTLAIDSIWKVTDSKAYYGEPEWICTDSCRSRLNK